jgi:hypothetical protein
MEPVIEEETIDTSSKNKSSEDHELAVYSFFDFDIKNVLEKVEIQRTI